jgi:hypothetical protein
MKRNVLLVLGGLLAGLALAGGVSGPLGAQSTSGKCDYTYVEDDGSPNLGKNGQIKYNSTWRKVLDEGWTLKMAGSDVGIYIFEKCH